MTAVRRALATARRRPRPAGERGTRSILIIAAEQDERPSTKCLHDIVVELERRDLDVVVWFVHAPRHAELWDGARVVDSLLDWPITVFLDRAGLRRAAFRLRGLRRHTWLLDADPDVVVFDDGVGDNLVKRIRGPHVRVVRANEIPPFDVPADLSTPVTDVDLTLVGPGTEPIDGSRALDAPFVRDWDTIWRDSPAAIRAEERAKLGIDGDDELVVGMGRDGWLDGPELFLRCLWTIAHRHGRAPLGVWLAPGADPNEIIRLEEEAARCGLADRVRFLVDGDPDLLLCGDVALLPYRTAGDVFDVLGLIGAGLGVVTFPVWGFEHPCLRTVPHLDLEAAGDEVVAVLDERRASAASGTPAHASNADSVETVAAWVDRFLAAVEECRR
jgi:hypothetical protein